MAVVEKTRQSVRAEVVSREFTDTMVRDYLDVRKNIDFHYAVDRITSPHRNLSSEELFDFEGQMAKIFYGEDECERLGINYSTPNSDIFIAAYMAL